MRVELCRDGEEETSAIEHAALGVVEPGAHQSCDPPCTLGVRPHGIDHDVHEECASGFDRGQLQLLLGAEERRDAALARLDLACEPGDREALEAVGRRDLYGARQYSPA